VDSSRDVQHLYAYGTRVDEATVRSEINRTAALGIELFVLDAGMVSRRGDERALRFRKRSGHVDGGPGSFSERFCARWSSSRTSPA